MDKMFVLGSRKWQIDPSLKIIPKEALERLYDANEIIDKARKVALEVEKKAQEDYDKRFKEGYEVGVEEGKSEYTFKIMEMVTAQLDSLEGLEKQLVEVVINAIAKVIGELDRDDLIVRVVRQGLNAVRGEKRILIKVSLNEEHAVREDLKAFLLSADGSSGYIEVLGDPGLRSGDCILETPMGVVEASLRSQLTILNKSLRERVGNGA